MLSKRGGLLIRVASNKANSDVSPADLEAIVPKGQSQLHPKKIRNFSLRRCTETNSEILQPVLDFQFVSENETNLQKSIDARGLVIERNVKELSKLYEKVKSCKRELDALKLEETENIKAFNAIKTKNKQIMSEESEDKVFQKIQEKGRDIRERLRNAIQNYHEANDELVEGIIQLPNILDPETPITFPILLRQNIAPDSVTSWNSCRHALSVVADYHSPGTSEEWMHQIPKLRNAATEQDLSILASEQLQLQGFSEVGPVDTVLKTSLNSVEMDTNNIIRLRECTAKSWDSYYATYLTGSSRLPSLFMMYSQSLVETSTVFPLRNFVIAHSELKDKAGFINNNLIAHCIVACRDKESMEIEFSNLSKFMEEFYAYKVGIKRFQTQCVPGIELAPYESKKYIFITNKSESSSPRLIGEISIIGDHLSKRILCCFKNEDGRTKFIHFVYANFFDFTSFLRGDDSILETSINN